METTAAPYTAAAAHEIAKRLDVPTYHGESFEEIVDRLGQEAHKLLTAIAEMSHCSIEDAAEAACAEHVGW